MPVAVDSCWRRAAAMTLRGQCLVFVSDRLASPTSHGMEAASPWSPPARAPCFRGHPRDLPIRRGCGPPRLKGLVEGELSQRGCFGSGFHAACSYSLIKLCRTGRRWPPVPATPSHRSSASNRSARTPPRTVSRSPASASAAGLSIGEPYGRGTASAGTRRPKLMFTQREKRVTICYHYCGVLHGVLGRSGRTGTHHMMKE